MKINCWLKYSKYPGVIDLSFFHSYFAVSKISNKHFVTFYKYKIVLLGIGQKIKIFLDETNYKKLIEYFNKKQLIKND
jgi:hypothetical protein